MNKITRFTSAILAIATISAIFTGCSKDKYKDDFKVALENSANIESASMKGDVSITLIDNSSKDEADKNEEVQEPAPLGTIKIDGKFMDKGLTSAITTSTSLFGMPAVDQLSYMKDGITYSTIPGEDRYLSQNLEGTIGMNIASLKELSKEYNAKFIEKVLASDVTYAKAENGFSAKFSITEDMYKEMLSDMFEKIFSSDEFKDQLRAESRTTLMAMGFTAEEIQEEEAQAKIEEDVKKVTDMVKAVFDNLKFNKFDMECIVNNGNIVSTKMDMVLDLEPIMNYISSLDPSAENAMPTGMLMGIKSNIELSEPNSVKEIEMPEFTEANTITMDKYLEEQMAAIGEMTDAEGKELPQAEAAKDGGIKTGIIEEETKDANVDKATTDGATDKK